MKLLNNNDDRQLLLCRHRRGITVIEVMFAMGIALVGLFGIASLLLLAGRQAGESNRASEGQAFSQDWYGEFSARGLNNSAKWAWWNDATPGMQWFSKTLGASAETPSKGSTALHSREYGRESVCLDPMFFAGRDLNNTLTPSNWYRPSVFPYYQDRYNPTIDPAYVNGMAGLQWADQPRMLRVTWATPSASSPYGPIAQTSRFLEQVFFSQDDYSVVLDEDKSVAPVRGTSFFEAQVPNQPLPLGRFAAESQYSWLATLSPTEPQNFATEATDLYTLSLVVINKRDRIVYDPAVTTPRNPGTPAVPTNTPQGERLTWVQTQSGNFSGGNGGRVRLISSDGVDPTVHVGDWVMLSKYYNFEAVAFGPLVLRPNSVFRWYRVVAVESDETVGPLGTIAGGNDPYGQSPPNNQVWGQDVVLEGPDWSFSPTVVVDLGGGNSTTVQTPTTGTLIKGTVSVYERIVNVQ